jgi:Domain of unknown function (DUF6458)
MKTATSLTLVAAGAIIAFAITAHVAFLNLQVVGWVCILTGVAGVIPRASSWLRRTRADRGGTGAASADGTRQRPPASRPPTPRAAPDARPAERGTIEEYSGA